MIVPDCPIAINYDLICNQKNCVYYAPKGIGCCIFKHKEAFLGGSISMSSFASLKNTGVYFTLIMFRLSIRITKVLICGLRVMEDGEGIYEKPSFGDVYQKQIRRSIKVIGDNEKILHLPLSKVEKIYKKLNLRPRDLFYFFLSRIEIEEGVRVPDLGIYALRENAKALFGSNEVDKLFPIKEFNRSNKFLY